MAEWSIIDGRVRRGHRVASGLARDPLFPDGTIRPQLPFFRAAIPDFNAAFDAPLHPRTINVRVPGHSVRPGRATHVVPQVRWHAIVPPENFLLTPCRLEHDGRWFRGLLYIPDPATKPDAHLQPDDIVEVLTSRVTHLRYGHAVRLAFPPEALIVTPRED